MEAVISGVRWLPVNEDERREAVSKTAGCRFDSCPTCHHPSVLNSSLFQASASADSYPNSRIKPLLLSS